MIPTTAIARPIIFLHSKGCFSTPKIPKSSITYDTVNWAITISIAAFAGPSADIPLITVIVIKAPITPPKRVYLLDVCHSAAILSLPVKNHAAKC